ncbi:MAG: hypothetical protein PHC86_03510 [Eubacteriales bacterium]|nr:hypothetical protein [Eubacteriales bacterium]
MSKGYYVQIKAIKKQRYKTLLITLMVLGLIVAGIYGIWRFQRQSRADNLLSDFNQAMLQNEYTRAIEFYRHAQALAVLPEDYQNQGEIYRSVLSQMEELINQDVLSIETKLLSHNTLTDEEIALCAGLEELSGLQLTRFIDKIGTDYITGRQDNLTITHVISQLKSLDNLQDELQGIEDQLTSIQLARPSVIAAEDLTSTEQWYLAYDAWLLITQQPDIGSYVQNYARTRLSDCKVAMYEPLLAEAQNNLNQNRTFSAQKQLLALQFIFPQDEAIQLALEQCDDAIPRKLEIYRSTVEHLTIKPLIVRPDLAFDGDVYSGAARDTMITTVEFGRMLEQLYANNYILIDQSRLLPTPGSSFAIELPAGKKPLVLVLEGLDYLVTRRETGNNWLLALNENQEVCGQYTDAQGRVQTEPRAESIGILDAFVKEHPDFSYDGAKALITITGYEGVFGYLTDPDQLDDRNQSLLGNSYPSLTMQMADYQENRRLVGLIIDRLKNTGYQFGSSTYAFLPVTNASLSAVEADWQKWQNQIEPLIGPVTTLQFPNGGILAFSDERSLFYQAQGITIFGGLGAAAYITRGNNLVYVDKVQISGYSLTHAGLYQLARLFDADQVIDYEARGLKKALG